MIGCHYSGSLIGHGQTIFSDQGRAARYKFVLAEYQKEAKRLGMLMPSVFGYAYSFPKLKTTNLKLHTCCAPDHTVLRGCYHFSVYACLNARIKGPLIIQQWVENYFAAQQNADLCELISDQWVVG